MSTLDYFLTVSSFIISARDRGLLREQSFGIEHAYVFMDSIPMIIHLGNLSASDVQEEARDAPCNLRLCHRNVWGLSEQMM